MVSDNEKQKNSLTSMNYLGSNIDPDGLDQFINVYVSGIL